MDSQWRHYCIFLCFIYSDYCWYMLDLPCLKLKSILLLTLSLMSLLKELQVIIHFKICLLGWNSCCHYYNKVVCIILFWIIYRRLLVFILMSIISRELSTTVLSIYQFMIHKTLGEEKQLDKQKAIGAVFPQPYCSLSFTVEVVDRLQNDLKDTLMIGDSRCDEMGKREWYSKDGNSGRPFRGWIECCRQWLHLLNIIGE